MQPRSISAHRAQATGEHRFSIWCLNAGVSLAWTALRQLPVSGLTSFGCVLGRTMRRRCCWRRFRPVASTLSQPRLLLSRSCPTLQLPWAVYPPGKQRCSVWILPQRSCLVCRLRCAPASHRPRPCWHAFACLPGPSSVRGVHGCACGPVLIMPRRACLRLILFCTCPPLGLCAAAPRPVLHLSAPVRSGGVADARMGLA